MATRAARRASRTGGSGSLDADRGVGHRGPRRAGRGGRPRPSLPRPRGLPRGRARPASSRTSSSDASGERSSPLPPARAHRSSSSSGRREVRFRPAPAAEREQLRQFCGAHELARAGERGLRPHPSQPTCTGCSRPCGSCPTPTRRGACPPPSASTASRRRRTFVLDAALPRSPWWLCRALGDASVTFETAGRGTLTYTGPSGDAEDITLFDRQRRLQICMLPFGRARPALQRGRRAHGGHPLPRPARALRARRLRPLRRGHPPPAAAQPRLHLRLRLHDSLRVLSVTSPRRREPPLLPRARPGQPRGVPGPLRGHGSGDIALTIRYAGFHDPPPSTRRCLQVRTAPPSRPETDDDEIFVERVPVYTNRTRLVPAGRQRRPREARLRLEAPAGLFVVSGGSSSPPATGERGTFAEYRLEQPAQVHDRGGGALHRPGHAAGRRALRFAASACPAPRGAAQDLMLTAREGPRLLLRAVRALSLLLPEPGRAEGGPPAGTARPGSCSSSSGPPLLGERGQLRDDPANFTRRPGLLPRPRARRTSGGARAVAPAELPRAVAGRSLGPVRGRALGAQEPRRGGVPGHPRPLRRWACATAPPGPSTSATGSGHLRGNPQIFRAVVYDKGAYVLHMLRAIVGDEASSARPCASFLEPAPASRRRAPTTCARRWRRRAARTCGPTSRAGSTARPCPRLRYALARGASTFRIAGRS